MLFHHTLSDSSDVLVIVRAHVFTHQSMARSFAFNNRVHKRVRPVSTGGRRLWWGVCVLCDLERCRQARAVFVRNQKHNPPSFNNTVRARTASPLPRLVVIVVVALCRCRAVFRLLSRHTTHHIERHASPQLLSPPPPTLCVCYAHTQPTCARASQRTNVYLISDCSHQAHGRTRQRLSLCGACL